MELELASHVIIPTKCCSGCLVKQQIQGAVSEGSLDPVNVLTYSESTT